MKILIAEDDKTSRLLLQKILEKWNYEVIVTSNGNSAWNELLKKNAPKLVILDWMMPGMAGVEICKQIRMKNPNNPLYIILLTALKRKSEIVQGLESGANDYISKPFDHNELLARIRVGERVINLETALTEHIDKLQDALEHIKTLQGILPVCMHCHKIKTDDASWEKIDAYIEKHTDAQISHSLCDDCLEKYYPDEEEN
jgi:DNA-binding response OmpR family regulator